jgi:hypothetical protein
MSTTIPQNKELINNMMELVAAHRGIFGQERVYERAVKLVLAEVMAIARHTVTQLLMALGMNGEDWSAWYRMFSRGRFNEAAAAEVMVEETLKHVGPGEVYVVGGDGTQVPRSGKRIEGVSWLRNLRTPPFKVGIHRAQRWFNGSWLMPAEEGYSRAMPLRWLPAFPVKAQRQISEPCKEWEAAVQFLNWLKVQLTRLGRAYQQILMVADGSFDTLEQWRHLPSGVVLLARSAKNRVLHQLAPAGAHRNRRYGERALTPEAFWRQRRGWHKTQLLIRGRLRDLQYRVEGPFLRKGAPDTPLFLIIVRGKTYLKHGHRKHREPMPYLVNALPGLNGQWVLPLPIDTLLFWAWQRWELEVCHREIKSGFGLGQKQCWNPIAALASVQWSAWVYSLLLLAGYRTWGLCGAPSVPTSWWQGSGRWSLNTLWRAYRAALWGSHYFRPLCSLTSDNWLENEALLRGLANSLFAAARS